MNYTYIREGLPFSVSDQLKLLAGRPCDQYFIERLSIRESVQLKKLLDVVASGDTLTIIGLQAFGKEPLELAALLKNFEKINVTLISWSQQFDLTARFGFWEKKDEKSKSILQKKEARWGDEQDELSSERVDSIRDQYITNRQTVAQLSERFKVSEKVICQLLLM